MQCQLWESNVYVQWAGCTAAKHVCQPSCLGSSYSRVDRIK